VTSFQQDEIPPMPRRKPSGGVTALGIISIIYSVFFYICCGFASFASPFFTEAFQHMAERQGLSGYQPTRAMQAFSFINGSVTVILGALLLIGGIGLLQLKPWGRSLSIAASLAVIVWALIIFILNIFLVYPATVRMLGDKFPQGQQMIISVVAGVFGVFMQLVYPIILVVCLNLKSIREEFGIVR
jgi:hypothetical protein